MPDNGTPRMQATLGLMGLTMNAMALIAPGAFLWLTFTTQAGAGNTSPAMWIGIVFALLLCLATALCYSEMAKLHPGGTGSSYYFAEQAFLSHDRVWRYARVSKFVVGWASHLYYWILVAAMLAFTGQLCGYIAGTLWPGFMSAANPGPMFMMLCAILFSFGVAWIAQRGVTGSTAVNVAINVIQISALTVFAVMAIGYRMNHQPGSVAWQWDATSSDAYNYQFLTAAQIQDGQQTVAIVRDSNGIPKPFLDPAGKPVPYRVSYPGRDDKGNFLTHPDAASVVGVHNFGWMFVQANIAILILVGFESATSMGGEAKNARRDIPIAVITSLLVQGAFCYLFEYFAANYALNSGYTLQNALGSAAPIGDLMVMVGDAVFGAGHGRTFMLIQAFTVFLALIGTTLSCMNTGARVTYAMGKDREAPEHFGLLHDENLTPHRAIWALAVIGAILGCLGLAVLFGDTGALSDATIAALPHGFWSSFGYMSHDTMAKLPNSLLTIELSANFGTFLLYGMSCVICIVGYHRHPNFSFIRHMAIPIFGLLANLTCMAFYLIGPFMGFGTKMEPLLALGVAAASGIYGGIYFLRSNKANGRKILNTTRVLSEQEVNMS